MAELVDRRAARTRKALHEALIALILRKGYEPITVQDILDEANVGRSTFYAHYTGKEDLLRSGFKELRSVLTKAATSAPPNKSLGFSLALFEHACAHKHIYRALVGAAERSLSEPSFDGSCRILCGGISRLSRVMPFSLRSWGSSSWSALL